VRSVNCVEKFMSGTRSATIVLSARQREVLERLVRSNKTAQQLVERCRIVLLSASGLLNWKQAVQLGVDRQRVSRWRRRWAAEMAALNAAEDAGASDGDLQQRIVQVLGDEARSGAPAKFSAEQVAQLIALACESPGDSALPVSHWTPSELAREAVKRGLVESISVRQFDRFLAQRTCDRTRVNTGSHRGTNVNSPSNTKPMLKRSAKSIDKPHSSPGKAPTS
jgi:putative transposase